jgi:hypothetical protein
MLSQCAEEIRSKVDALAFGPISEDANRQNARADILGFLKSRGLFETSAEVLAERSDVFCDSQSLHRCPWHTCANTKH